jgi:hypothetical protein
VVSATLDEGELPLQATLNDTGHASGSGVHVKLDLADIVSLSDDSNTFHIFGSAGDSLDAGGGWSAAGQDTIDGAVFNIYIQGDTVLKVDCDIDQNLIGLV